MSLQFYFYVSFLYNFHKLLISNCYSNVVLRSSDKPKINLYLRTLFSSNLNKIFQWALTNKQIIERYCLLIRHQIFSGSFFDVFFVLFVIKSGTKVYYRSGSPAKFINFFLQKKATRSKRKTGEANKLLGKKRKR